MLGTSHDSVVTDFEEKDLQHPVPREIVDIDGTIIYMSWGLRIPKDLGGPDLCGFGSALARRPMPLGIQPNIYRAPGVILGVPWTHRIDI